MENESALLYDYGQCGAIWRRVAPELEPYPFAEETEARKSSAAEEVERLLGRMAERKEQYGLHSRRVACVPVQRVMQELATGEAAAVRRLAAVYYVLSQSSWAGAKKCDLPLQPWQRWICLLLRQTEEDGRTLRRLAAGQEDTSLCRSLEQLAAEEQQRAAMLLHLLESYALA